MDVAKSREDVEVVALVDIQEAAAQKRQEQYGLSAAVVSTDLEAVLADQRPDVVFDVTIPESHAEVTLQALAHGCHVMGEKPLAHNMESAREMVAAAEAAGKIFAVMQNRRYDPRIRGLRAFVESGQIGKLTTLNSDFYIGAHFGGFRDHMEHVLLLDMAIHSFDQARLISGADPVAVYCTEWNPAGSWYDHDASAVAIFEMSGGVIYTYRGSWCAEGLNTSWECEWRAIGERGTATWDGGDGLRAQAAIQPGGFHSELKPLEIGPARTGRPNGHAGAINEFLDCVQSGEMPETAAADNIKSLAMVFGAIESAEKRERAPITI
ncbi:MAG: Gfo/Idh/MocA family oxidoreductase [Chloroflexi bacterium]|nr:Gfo/Idh/MocA family oxidoreductase [Chloroflexota bacterium]